MVATVYPPIDNHHSSGQYFGLDPAPGRPKQPSDAGQKPQPKPQPMPKLPLPRLHNPSYTTRPPPNTITGAYLLILPLRNLKTLIELFLSLEPADGNDGRRAGAPFIQPVLETTLEYVVQLYNEMYMGNIEMRGPKTESEVFEAGEEIDRVIERDGGKDSGCFVYKVAGELEKLDSERQWRIHYFWPENRRREKKMEMEQQEQKEGNGKDTAKGKQEEALPIDLQGSRLHTLNKHWEDMSVEERTVTDRFFFERVWKELKKLDGMKDELERMLVAGESRKEMKSALEMMEQFLQNEQAEAKNSNEYTTATVNNMKQGQQTKEPVKARPKDKRSNTAPAKQLLLQSSESSNRMSQGKSEALSRTSQQRFTPRADLRRSQTDAPAPASKHRDRQSATYCDRGRPVQSQNRGRPVQSQNRGNVDRDGERKWSGQESDSYVRYRGS